MRLVKLEDNNADQLILNDRQAAINAQISSRVNNLEEEIVSMRQDLKKLATQYQVHISNDLSQILPLLHYRLLHLVYTCPRISS